MSNISVLGVDPGLATFGLAYHDGAHWQAETWRTSPRDGTDAERLALLLDRLRCHLDAHPADVLALETQFVNPEAPGGVGRSVLLVARVAGAVVGLARERGIAVVDVTPQRAKLALTGDGKADKRRMVECANQAYGLALTPGQHHAADALGMELAGETKWRFQQQREQAVIHRMAGIPVATARETAGEAYARTHGDKHQGVKQRVVG
jgi:crossover junction endodeoxyribonuclease RuvC